MVEDKLILCHVHIIDLGNCSVFVQSYQRNIVPKLDALDIYNPSAEINDSRIAVIGLEQDVTPININDCAQSLLADDHECPVRTEALELQDFLKPD